MQTVDMHVHLLSSEVRFNRFYDRAALRVLGKKMGIDTKRLFLEPYQAYVDALTHNIRSSMHLSHSVLFGVDARVDDQGKVNFYDGRLRVVDPNGKIFVEFEGREYLEHLEERVEPWSYMKPLYLKNVGWKGFTDGLDSGIYRVGPLARFNVSHGMATPLAQAEYERMVDHFGGKHVHNTLAYHWARLIEGSVPTRPEAAQPDPEEPVTVLEP